MTKPGPGRFENCESLEVAEALYEIGLAGDADDDFYDQADNYYNLIVNIDPENLIPVGAYITKETESGAFFYTYYDSEASARREWNQAMENHVPSR